MLGWALATALWLIGMFSVVRVAMLEPARRYRSWPELLLLAAFWWVSSLTIILSRPRRKPPG